MKNNLLQQLKNSIKNLEFKLDKTKNLKTKLEILQEINRLKSQLTEILESNYEAVTAEKIRDINKQIEKATQRGKFMKDYYYDLRS